jgi:hypothetical protein
MEKLPTLAVEHVALYSLFGSHQFRNSAQGAAYPEVFRGLSHSIEANFETIV